MPSRPVATHDAWHRPQTRRSLPSFVQPHLEAATGSRHAGLFAQVDILNVSSRNKKDGKEDGLYSAPGSNTGEDELSLKENAFLVRVAARDNIAVRCGVFFTVSPNSGAVLLRARGELDPLELGQQHHFVLGELVYAL